MTYKPNPIHVPYAVNKKIQDQFESNMGGFTKELFTMIERKPFLTSQDKKTLELLGCLLEFSDAVSNTQNGLVESNCKFNADTLKFAKEQAARTEEIFELIMKKQNV